MTASAFVGVRCSRLSKPRAWPPSAGVGGRNRPRPDA